MSKGRDPAWGWWTDDGDTAKRVSHRRSLEPLPDAPTPTWVSPDRPFKITPADRLRYKRLCLKHGCGYREFATASAGELVTIHPALRFCVGYSWGGIKHQTRERHSSGAPMCQSCVQWFASDWMSPKTKQKVEHAIARWVAVRTPLAEPNVPAPAPSNPLYALAREQSKALAGKHDRG